MPRRTFTVMLLALLSSLGLLVPFAASPALAEELSTVSVSVQNVTVDPRTGEATVTGAVACSQPGTTIGVYAALTQQIGKLFALTGYGNQTVECPGPEGASFSITFSAYSGKFGPGSARLYVNAYDLYCNPYMCPYDYDDSVDTTIHIIPAPGG